MMDKRKKHVVIRDRNLIVILPYNIKDLNLFLLNVMKILANSKSRIYTLNKDNY